MPFSDARQHIGNDGSVVAATKINGADRPRKILAVAELNSGKVDLFVPSDPLA